MKLRALAPTLAVCRFDADAPVPGWAMPISGFFSVTRTAEELSVVCEQSLIPRDCDARVERDWRAFQVVGPLDFSLTGILAALANPLASAGISIFAVSTFDTDYLLVKAADFERAVGTLSATGHAFADR